MAAGKKEGNYTTDSKTLQKLMKKYPKLDFLNKITEAKQADKKLSTYYLNFLKFKDANDIIHAELNQEKAITGRSKFPKPAQRKMGWNLRSIYD